MRQWYIAQKTKLFGPTHQGSRTGIHISTTDPWLAASLDGIIVDSTQAEGRHNSILEVKCPYSGRTMTPEVACQEVNRFCSSLVDGQITLKKSCNYYYQLQGQLRVTQ